MRALLLKAQFLDVIDRRKEAVAIYERMLKLNPNDNQGVRYILIGILLAERMMPKARKLLEALPHDNAAWFTWCVFCTGS